VEKKSEKIMLKKNIEKEKLKKIRPAIFLYSDTCLHLFPEFLFFFYSFEIA